MLYAVVFAAGAFFGLSTTCVFVLSGQESRKEEQEQSRNE